MAKNVRSQRQFRGGYIPDEPVDEWNRQSRQEPSSPSAQRRRMGVNLGSQTQANPGLAGMQDRPRKAKSRGRK